MADNTTVAVELGAALQDPVSAQPASAGQSIPYVVIPQAYKVEDLEKLFPVPTRKRGNTTLRDAASFCAFVEVHKKIDSLVFCNPTTPSFIAVFNASGEEPGWQDHTAVYSCPKSVEWQTWLGKNGSKLSQEDFAQFIEDNAPDCVAPDSATMIEISRSLEAKKSVNFASSKRLSSGQHLLAYEETITGTAGKGQFEIPEVFEIGIAALEGGPKYRVQARLRYRIADGGKLTMWYDLDRPHKVMEDAVEEVAESIGTKTGMTVLFGTP